VLSLGLWLGPGPGGYGAVRAAVSVAAC
jgi:hypothetical protein